MKFMASFFIFFLLAQYVHASEVQNHLFNVYPEKVIKQVLEEVIEEKMLRSKIAEKHLITQSTLSKWINRYNQGKYLFDLGVKKIQKRPGRDPKPFSFIQSVLKEVVSTDHSKKIIAEKYDIAPSTIHEWIKNYNQGRYLFNVGVPHIGKMGPQRRNPDVIQQTLKDVELGILSRTAIAKKNGISLRTLIRWVNEYNAGKYTFVLHRDYIEKKTDVSMLTPEKIDAAVKEILFDNYSKIEVSQRYQISIPTLELFIDQWLASILMSNLMQEPMENVLEDEPPERELDL